MFDTIYVSISCGRYIEPLYTYYTPQYLQYILYATIAYSQSKVVGDLKTEW